KSLGLHERFGVFRASGDACAKLSAAPRSCYGMGATFHWRTFSSAVASVFLETSRRNGVATSPQRHASPRSQTLKHSKSISHGAHIVSSSAVLAPHIGKLSAF